MNSRRNCRSFSRSENIAEEILLSQTKPPFRAEHIGSLLRPQSLLETRARFEPRRDQPRRADRGRRQSHQGCARAAGTRGPGIRHRRRIPPPLLSQLLLPPARRHQHRHDWRRRSQRWHAGTARRSARCDDQEPRALDQGDQRSRLRVHRGQQQARSEDHDSRPVCAALPRRRRRGAGKRIQGRRSVLGRHGRGLRQGIEGARRCRLPLRAD